MEKIIYDEDEDILSLSKGNKVKSSIDVGDFVVDIDMKGFVTGVEIHNASENLHISKLNEITEASMVVYYKPNYITIRITLGGKDITIPLTIDLGHELKEETKFAIV